ncbi:hypothetical protein, conserved [Eimeria maxima]|uniref:Uncharacterized protein n=1 Tax=Eimeria maxima TaxID=5804 RepID=U6MGJ8_EIMMA|nr:hypothetical protein, conserved [Eimeria maxima]CDJ60775.1 hypothetical protein, conserved [Eimeria maxima]
MISQIPSTAGLCMQQHQHECRSPLVPLNSVKRKQLRPQQQHLQQLTEWGGGASKATAAATAAAAPTPLALHQDQLEAVSAALFCSAAEAVALLAEMQMKPSVRDAVPTLLLALERLRLSQQLRRCQRQQLQQEQQKVLNSEARGSLATPLVTEKAAAIAAAEAAVRCLHALGRCQLFSEKLLQEVSAHHIAAADADTLALYIFECGHGCFERALAAVQEMSGASLLLACAGLYRFCTDWKPFYESAAPRLLQLYIECCCVLRACMGSCEGEVERFIATFVERRCPNTPAEYGVLTRALVAAIEASAPPLPLAASGRASEEAGAGAAGAEGVAGDPLSLVHPLHDLVDLVDCVASHGLQSSAVRRVEAVVAARYTEIEYSVNFTLWLVCLDAFSRVKGHYPHMLLQHITANMYKAVDNGGGSSTWAYKNSSNGSLSSPLDSLSALQRLKFMQALTRLSFFPLPVVQVSLPS